LFMMFCIHCFPENIINFNLNLDFWFS
jgi:hypothetical protein